jgi:hypothetical protein
MNMEEERLCIACGAALAGPFQPEITLSEAVAGKVTGTLSAEETEAGKVTGTLEVQKVSAHAWICPGCGLVHWYVADEDLDLLLAVALSEETLAPTPGTSYERRTQMVQMLRRVRRM